MSLYSLEEVLHPRSIAIVGASDVGRGGGFLRPLQEMPFKGKLYPVNPKYEKIGGLKAYPKVSAIPGPVDYVISSIPSQFILDLIEDCAQKNVRAIHLFTARFSETGRKDATELEYEVLKRARAADIRIIGPNCMGVYYPKMGIAFNTGWPKETGGVGFISQSGQVVGEVVNFAARRGVRFSKAISYGNAVDLNECDYLEYLAQDTETTMILMYIEGVRDGVRFFESLKRATALKPVVIVKGGRGSAGTRATASHTASMAGSQQVWQALFKQTGAISCDNLEDLVDLAVAFYFLPSCSGRNLAVVGGSGGSSVLAADQCEEAGLNVIPFPRDIRDRLRKEGSSIWDWIGNPADFSISMGEREAAIQIGRMMVEHPAFDAIMAFTSIPWNKVGEKFSMDEHVEQFFTYLEDGKPTVFVFQEMVKGRTRELKQLLKLTADMKQKLIDNRFAVYPTISRAARALSKMIGYYESRV
ncbi:MAG: CoA-binding protein [Deltaproteobacteria bacterium]|nr:CoA-binding protein [Deltaproteobacteria bacterium]